MSATHSSGAETKGNKPWYRAVWRWHFYAGLYVIPFLLLLALSGMGMLLSKPLDGYLQRDLSTVTPVGDPRPASTLLRTVKAQYPNAQIKLYLPPHDAGDSARFSVAAGEHSGHGGHGAPSTTVYVDPYTGDIIASLDPATTLYARIKTFHSSLYLGKVGSTLIEIAAGLAVLMVLSGVFLALSGKVWPQKNRPRPQSSTVPAKREDWRRWHGLIGLLLTLPLLFFLLSGLAWTDLWGGQLVQPWSSLPGTRFQGDTFEQHQQHQQHQSMNQHGLHQVPWAVEQTPLPQSASSASGPHTSAHDSSGHPSSGHPSSGQKGPVNLDRVVEIARAEGFGAFRVHLPQTAEGVWTVSATSIAGDITNPFQERILHLDRFTGEVLADIRYADYPAMGKAMAASIPAHQGDLGGWNWLLNLLLLVAVMALVVTGVVMWWRRRPQTSRRLSPPATSQHATAVIASMAIVALLFPLSAALLALVIALDYLLIERATRLRDIFK